MLTVLFATRNRPQSLAAVLDSYLRLSPPSGGWRLVVVDNGDDPRTREVLTGLLSRLPLTVVRESRPGKNVALNTGLSHLDGDLAVFTDDDVYPDPNWLVALRQAADAHPSFSILGGTVLPRWESPPPPWILDWVPLGPVYTLTGDLPDGPTTPHTVFGPNMAVRCDVFQQGVRFDQGIGPRAGSYAMGSETELVRRLSAAGHRAWHVAAARVEHFIRAEQLDRAWILRRAVNFGRGQYRLDPAPPGPRWAGVPRWLCGEVVRRAWRVARWSAAANPRERFRAQWDLAFSWGQMLEARGLAGEMR